MAVIFSSPPKNVSRRLGFPGVASTLRIARRGCLKHVDAAMLIAWMEKIEKHKRNTRFADPEPLVAMASHSLMSPVLLNLCGTIERESGRGGQPQHNDNTVPGSHGMGSILD